MKRILDEIVKHNEMNPDLPIGFDYDGVFITNPYLDETGRNPVDPLTYYGEDRIRELIEIYQGR